MNGKHFVVVTREEVATVPNSEILYLECHMRQISLHTIHRSYHFRGKFGSLLPLLGESFLRCHNSIIVNLEKIRCVTFSFVHWDVDHPPIQLGRTSYLRLRRHFLEYLSASESCHFLSRCNLQNDCV